MRHAFFIKNKLGRQGDRMNTPLRLSFPKVGFSNLR